MRGTGTKSVTTLATYIDKFESHEPQLLNIFHKKIPLETVFLKYAHIKTLTIKILNCYFKNTVNTVWWHTRGPQKHRSKGWRLTGTQWSRPMGF